MAVLAAGGVTLAELLPRQALRSPTRPVASDGNSAYSMAMHVHSSFSEQSGSMDSQLFQATKNSVDVLWWTDHDERMDGLAYRRTVHFTSLTAESGGAAEGGPWIWTKVVSGPVTSASDGGIVEHPCSPEDPVVGGSLHLTAKSSSTATAKYGYYANSHPAGWNYRDNLTGQSLAIDVLLTSGWTQGYLELLIATSYHEAAAGRPAGGYSLSYRFVPPGVSASRVANGNDGVITIPVLPASSANPWCTTTIAPSRDIAALWPDLDYRDFALFGLTLNAASEGESVGGYFDYLRFDRRMGGEAALRQQIEMEAVLAPRYPSVVQRQGLEISGGLPHLNWFGGAVANPDYGTTTLSSWSRYLEDTLVPEVHRVGGLVSYNHPYGMAAPPALPVAQQNALLARTAKKLLPTAERPAALGCDLLEVGYTLRQGVDLAHHVALWDVLSRNGVFLTGNGTNDDHFGQNWHGIVNNWVTSAWAASTKEEDLLASLAAGRAWCSSLSRYRGSLDLTVDGACPMGSVSVSKLNSRQLVAHATGLPAGGALQILQGEVDYAGTAAPAANTHVIASYGADEMAAGSVKQPVDTYHHSFVRTQVVDQAGRVVGLSNPVFLLRVAPKRGIPTHRSV
jgi:hypothetical protein